MKQIKENTSNINIERKSIIKENILNGEGGEGGGGDNQLKLGGIGST